MSGFWVNSSVILLIFISWSQNGCHSCKHHVLIELNLNRNENVSFMLLLFFFFIMDKNHSKSLVSAFQALLTEVGICPLAHQSVVEKRRLAWLAQLILLHLSGLEWGPNFLEHIASSNLNKIHVISKERGKWLLERQAKICLMHLFSIASLEVLWLPINWNGDTFRG